MLTRLAGTAVVVGCSYPPLPPLDGCWPQWRDHRVAIDPPTVRELAELSGTGSERNPWLSDDGLRLYFTRDPGPQGMGDVYLASRGSTTEGFGVPAPVVNLNSPAHEHRAALSPDEQTLVLSTERSGAL
ncbi:MAG TPA: hypothetical protein VK601_27430, partial [Kofleriaceae bacterium]|nr:hypothetical protein [Kofleriaceae bacterium]